MFRFNITDRRLNPHGKSLGNRRRFVERVKAAVKTAANKQIKNRSIEDKSDAEVTVSKDGIEEPQFHYAPTKGHWDHVLPGNHDYQVGDTIPRPPSGGGGTGKEGSKDGDGNDDFKFFISYEEYINAILEDLSLPDMIKTSQKEAVSFSWRRAGYTTAGAANNLALERTMIQGIGRRIALKTPKLVQIEELSIELENESNLDRKLEIEEQIAQLRRQADAISFLEKADLRYVNYVKQPHPISQAVMFLLMDVSGSMNEHMKELAKRFYLLMYVFLSKQYKYVDIVFIRHTHVAKEVTQEEFFSGTETGGTVVSTAYIEMQKIIKDRYNTSDWNIYMAQASDGDNTSSDTEISKKLLEEILPTLQYATYVEVAADFAPYTSRETDVWSMFSEICKNYPQVAARKIKNQGEVVEVFRSLFKKKTTAA